ncbi:MAG: DUF2142 domain-containing protein [bacterium]|nr:DUF2142 domain-containing protein [bacterium]
MKKISSDTFLLLILLIFIIKGIFFIFLVPPWEAPDEPGHVAYVEYLYKFKNLPSALKPLISLSINRSFEENKKILKNIRTKKLNTIEKKDLWNRSDRRLDPAPVNLASHPPLYYIYLLPFYIISLPFSSYLTLVFLRFASVILGLWSLFITFSLGKKLFKKNINLSYLLVFLVSFQPMFSFTHAVVNSDAFVIFAFLYFLNNALEIVKKKKVFHKDLFTLTLVAGFGPLMKPQLVILFIVFGLVLRWVKVSRKKFFAFFSLPLVPTIIWFFYKYLMEGGRFISYSVQVTGDTARPIWMYPVEFILQKQPAGIFMSFWGFFGWLNVPMPKWIYLLFLAVIVCGVGGWFTRVKKIRSQKISKENILLFSACFLYVLSIVVFDIQVFALAHHFVIHGRYLAPILPFLLVFIVQGISFYSQQLFRNILLTLTIATFILSSVVMYMTLSHYYYGINFVDPFYLLKFYKL